MINTGDVQIFLTTGPILILPSFPWIEFAIATFGLIILNVIVGIIPVSLYLRLTPSKILTKYDV